MLCIITSVPPEGRVDHLGRLGWKTKLRLDQFLDRFLDDDHPHLRRLGRFLDDDRRCLSLGLSTFGCEEAAGDRNNDPDERDDGDNAEARLH